MSQDVVTDTPGGLDLAVVTGGGPDGRSDATTFEARRFLYVRIGFGLLWGIDAAFKWLPGFRRGFAPMIANAAAGQPHWLAPWFHFWDARLAAAPSTYAVLIAIAETAICLSLVLGIAQRIGFTFGAIFGLLIWGVGEGFGGPYVSGSTDIGCAVIYTLLFVALLVAVPRGVRARAGSLDNVIVARWPRFAALTFARAV